MRTKKVHTGYDAEADYASYLGKHGSDESERIAAGYRYAEGIPQPLKPSEVDDLTADYRRRQQRSNLTGAEIQAECEELANQRRYSAPVEVGKVPNWLRLHLLQANRNKQLFRLRYGADGWNVLQDSLLATCGDETPPWLDHWGASTQFTLPAFVTEPYLTESNIPYSVHGWADAFDLSLYIGRDAWWAPGCVRIAFVKRDQQDF